MKGTTAMNNQVKTIEWSKLIDEALTVKGSLGNTYNRFYNYSFMNQIYLWLQGVNEPVATYKVWQANGRQVNKGEKAKMIVRPTFYKDQNEDGEEEYQLRGFKPVNCIFTYSQTTGEELPPVEVEKWHIATACENLNIEEVSFTSMNGNTAGYSFDRKYAINPMAKYPLKTTMHELAHIVLGHTDKEHIHEYKTHRGIKEFQAEATAYLVMKELEMLEHANASESRAYIQHWLQNEKPEDKAIKQVFKAVNDILTAGKPNERKES